MNKFEKITDKVLTEVEKIFEENKNCQGIHLVIDMGVGELTTINYEIKNKFIRINED